MSPQTVQSIQVIFLVVNVFLVIVLAIGGFAIRSVLSNQTEKNKDLKDENTKMNTKCNNRSAVLENRVRQLELQMARLEETCITRKDLHDMEKDGFKMQSQIDALFRLYEELNVSEVE